MAQKCFADAFAGTDISPIQYALLSTIGSNPGVNHRDMAAAVATAASVATTALKPLLEQEMVLTERDAEDSRSITYRLSKPGTALLNQLRKRLTKTSEALEKPLTAQEAEQLRKLLTKLIEGAPT
ncbi:MAG TPA: MarR family winged helix-turn-helix transcriptional regulator [Xanthobacteraceae bacterium]|nr:MarR family winged helix-turn-helix transcriptional regulator [Xanthobacteraceae bacterium]